MNVCVACGPPACPPSPKSHTVETASPSGSCAAELKLTFSGAVPPAGSAATWMVGAWLAGGSPTTIATVAVALAPARSVAVTSAVNVPVAVYVCRARRPAAPGVPSPKSHA